MFDENGDFVRIDRNDQPDKIVIENSQTCEIENTYEFTDPENDTKDIKNGIINKLVIVDEPQIEDLIRDAGAFEKENRNKPADFLLDEARGNGKFDFSYKVIPNNKDRPFKLHLSNAFCRGW